MIEQDRNAHPRKEDFYKIYAVANCPFCASMTQTLIRVEWVGTATLNGESAHTLCPAISSCTPAPSGEGLSV